MKNTPYLVRLKLSMGDIEKSNIRLVWAPNEREAGKAALLAECNFNADFSDYPDENGCWDGAEMIYTVKHTKALTDEQAQQYQSLISAE